MRRVLVKDGLLRYLLVSAETPEPMQDSTNPAALNDLSTMKFGVGQPVRRTEDPTLVRGQGRYTDDINLDGQVYAVMVRSRDAHGSDQIDRH